MTRDGHRDRRAIMLGRPTHNLATGRKLIDLADAVSPMEERFDRAVGVHGRRDGLITREGA